MDPPNPAIHSTDPVRLMIRSRDWTPNSHQRRLSWKKDMALPVNRNTTKSRSPTKYTSRPSGSIVSKRLSTNIPYESTPPRVMAWTRLAARTRRAMNHHGSAEAASLLICFIYVWSMMRTV